MAPVQATGGRREKEGLGSALGVKRNGAKRSEVKQEGHDTMPKVFVSDKFAAAGYLPKDAILERIKRARGGGVTGGDPTRSAAKGWGVWDRRAGREAPVPLRGFRYTASPCVRAKARLNEGKSKAGGWGDATRRGEGAGAAEGERQECGLKYF